MVKIYQLLMVILFSCNAIHGALPRNFRMMHNPIALKKTSNRGLEKLRASGSGQFQAQEIQEVKKRVGSTITIVDLRKEPHNLTYKVPFTRCITYKKKKSCITAQVKKTANEAALAKSLNVGYLHIPVVDGKLPSNSQIDQFVTFLATNKNWLHIHCLAGRGRTTTFLSLNDIFVNASQVPLHEIINRQSALGNYKLREHQSKIQLLTKFYAYMQARKKGTTSSWSAWIKKNQSAR